MSRAEGENFSHLEYWLDGTLHYVEGRVMLSDSGSDNSVKEEQGMKVWCVFIITDTNTGCFELKAIFHSQAKAEAFAIEFEEGGVEFFIEKMWVK